MGALEHTYRALPHFSPLHLLYNEETGKRNKITASPRIGRASRSMTGQKRDSLDSITGPARKASSFVTLDSKNRNVLICIAVFSYSRALESSLLSKPQIRTMPLGNVRTKPTGRKYQSTHHLYITLIMNILQETSVDWSYFSRLSLHALLRYIINSLIINKINRGRIILLRTAEVHGEV